MRLEQAQREGEARLEEAEATHAAEVVEALGKAQEQVQERDFFIDNLLVRIHFIIVMIRWTGLAAEVVETSLFTVALYILTCLFMVALWLWRHAARRRSRSRRDSFIDRV